MRTSILLAAFAAALAGAAARADSRAALAADLPWLARAQGEILYKPQYQPAPGAGSVRCNSAALAGVLGSMVGGTLGSQLGKGEARTLGTIGGAVAGVLVDGALGRRIDAGGQACVGEVLEMAPNGRRVQWGQGAITYAAVPAEVTYRQGAWCRPFALELRKGSGRWERTQAIACRRPDGVWMAG